MLGRRRLFKSFTIAAIGLASVFASSAALAEKPDAPKQTYYTSVTPVPSDHDFYIGPELPVSLPELTIKPEENDIDAVHVESLSVRLNAMLFNNDPSKIVTRHAKTGAYILNYRADQVYGGDVPVFFYETSKPIHDVLFDHKGPEAKDIFNNYRYITVSMGSSPNSPVKGNILKTKQDVEEADALWDGDFVLVRPEGNYQDNHPDLEQAAYRGNHTARADTFPVTGEAEIAEDGTVFISPHSGLGEAQATFVTLGPLTHGGKGRHVRNKDEVSARLDFLAKLIPHGQTDPVGMLLEAQPREELKTKLAKYSDYFPSVSFGEHATNRSYLAAAIHSTLAEKRKKKEVDDEGYAHKVKGTSTISVDDGGVLVGMHKRYPQLTEYDIYMAAILACDPVALTYVEDDDENKTVKVMHYQHNGAGKYFNPKRAGYGLFDFSKFAKIVPAMAEAQRNNPELATQRLKAESGYIIPSIETFETDGEVKRYFIDIADDIVTVSANLTLRFHGRTVPDEVAFVNAAGGRSVVVPLAPESPGDLVALRFGGQEFGRSKGRCYIEFKGDAAVREWSVTFRGTQRKGLIEATGNGMLAPNQCHPVYPTEKKGKELYEQGVLALNPVESDKDNLEISMASGP
ncbi:hypothetical protein N9Z27_01285 [Alphaproteobacteria bacterium]|nr:hypothetical protein [Alphaproteobacteria bacterium]